MKNTTDGFEVSVTRLIPVHRSDIEPVGSIPCLLDPRAAGVTAIVGMKVAGHRATCVHII